jgi:hypothetical protein
LLEEVEVGGALRRSRGFLGWASRCSVLNSLRKASPRRWRRCCAACRRCAARLRLWFPRLLLHLAFCLPWCCSRPLARKLILRLASVAEMAPGTGGARGPSPCCARQCAVPQPDRNSSRWTRRHGHFALDPSSPVQPNRGLLQCTQGVCQCYHRHESAGAELAEDLDDNGKLLSMEERRVRMVEVCANEAVKAITR